MSILKKYTLLFLILSFCSAQSFGSTEILWSFSIVELSAFCEEVVEAEFLKKDEDKFYILYRPITSQDNYKDTLVIPNNYLAFEDNGLRQIEHSDKLILYLKTTNGKKGVAGSGYRLLKDERIHYPFQVENPGGYHFFGIGEQISWADYKSRVNDVHQRMAKVKSLNQIENLEEKNRRLLEWLEVNQDDLGKECRPVDSDCGWGTIERGVFKWITESNIAEDTWYASQLYRVINSKSKNKWKRSNAILKEQDKSSFTSYEDIDFLVNKAVDENAIMVERRQALGFLYLASKKVFENNYNSIPDSTTLAFQTEKQLSIRNSLIPLLQDSILKDRALFIISFLSRPMYASLTHRINLDILPTLIEIYSNEKPGRYKSNLTVFIVFNATKEVWKEISGCDEKIFVDLYQVHVDTIKKELRFGMNYRNGKEDFYSPPQIVIESISDNKTASRTDLSSMKLPYSKSDVLYSKTPIEHLPKGKYKVYLTGSAGEKDEFNWTSEYGEFSIE